MKGIALTFATTAEGSSWRTAIADTAAEKALVVIRQFKLTPEITDGYAHMIGQYNASSKADKLNKKALELAVIAKHEQLRVLRPLIYNDPRLKETMDMNHQFSRLTGGWLSLLFKVVYSFNPAITDPSLQAIFDEPTGLGQRLWGNRASLTNASDRMKFVEKIAIRFNKLMSVQRPYMEGELMKIRSWINA